MRSSATRLAAALFVLTPGILMAQYRIEPAFRGPVGGQYPYSAWPEYKRPFPPDKPPYGFTDRVSTVEEWANAMETGIRDPFKRAFKKNDDVRNVYLTQDRASRIPPLPRMDESELRTAIQQDINELLELERIKEQERELRIRRSLYENRLRTVPSPGLDRR